jgi:hypothetical protein
MTDVDRLLAESEIVVPARWPDVEEWIRARFGRDPGLESVLFLVGIQSRGTGYTPQLDRDEKQDLIMQGSSVVLGELGIHERPAVGPSPESSARLEIPKIPVEWQESLLKLGAIRYFEQFMDSP